MLSTWFALAGVAAIVLLLARYGQRQARPRLMVVLTALAFTAGGLALLVMSFEYFQAGKAWRFGSSGIPAARAGQPLYFWISTALVTVAGAALSAIGLYLLRLSSMRQRQVAKRALATLAAALPLSDRLLSTPATFAADFRGEGFGRSEGRVELLARARKLPARLPEFSKSTFAAALSWYTFVPKAALADALTPADLAQIAAALVALECQQQSEPPERADYHYRALIGFGKADDSWWGQVLEALAGNAGRITDTLSAADSMSLVARLAAPASAARNLAVAWLGPFLHACEQPRAERDYGTTREINFLASTTANAAQDDEITLLANTVFWERARRCRALDDTWQYASLMLAGMSSGSAALGHQAMEALCSEFPKLAATSVAEAAAVVDALYRQRRHGRGPLPAACLAQVEPMLAAIAPEALNRVRQAAANRESEWWM